MSFSSRGTLKRVTHLQSPLGDWSELARVTRPPRLPAVLTQKDNLIDEHYNRLYRLVCLYCTLRSHAVKEKPKGDAPLAKSEFRCFGCGGVIKQEDDSCRICGWTWK